MAVTTTGGFTNFIPNYWDRQLGDNLRPNLYFYDIGEMRKLPANFGTSIKIPRLRKSGVAGTTNANIVDAGGSTEGVVTATCALSSEFVSGTLKKFKGAYKHSDLVVMTALSDVIQLSLEDLSYDLALKMDTHIRNQISPLGLGLLANSTVSKAGAPTKAFLSQGLVATHSFKPKDLAKMEVLLEKRNNPRFPGSNKYAYVINPEQKYDIITATSTTFAGWIDVNKYNNAEKIFAGEIGSFLGFKIVSTTNAKTSFGMCVAGTSYSIGYAFAPRAYYVTELSEMSARTYVKQLGSGGTSDPTNDICTVGAKVFFTAIPGGSAFNASTTEYRCIRLYSVTNTAVAL